jgi:hypothetical protein
MPLLLQESEILPQVAGVRSVLIVPCRFCPAASLAVREDKPYIELFRRSLRTEAFESFIETLRRRLQDEGIKTAVFDSKLLHQFVACMWTRRRRSEFAKRAADFEAVLVLGCDGMVAAVRDALKSTDCRVIPGMEVEGMMNLIPTASLPCNLSLELRSVTPVMKETSATQ